MSPRIKQLRLVDLFLNRSGTPTFRIILAIFGIALKLFFRRIETVNADSVPKGTGVIFVMNHPNGLIDPALVFVALPRKIAFLAKSTLFKMPVISFLLRTVEALPVYRRVDAAEDVGKNLETFELAHKRLQSGGSIALFPEGVSHNSPKLLPMKTGAARIALGAVSISQGEDIDVRIVPVGLFYTSKSTFRSEALLHFGEAFSVEKGLVDANDQPAREDVQKLTSQIESAIGRVTLNAETDAQLHDARIAEEIISSTSNVEHLSEKLEFLQSFITERANSSLDGSRISSDVRKFDAELDKYGIGPEHLSLAQFDRSFVVKQAIYRTWWLLLLLPIATLGALLHFPAYQLCRLFANWYARHGADDVASTVKVLAGILFMPATWLIVGIIVFYFFGIYYALVSVPLSALLGLIALHTIERFEDLRGWANAIGFFLSRRETFLRLFVERRELQKKLRLTVET